MKSSEWRNLLSDLEALLNVARELQAGVKAMRANLSLRMAKVADEVLAAKIANSERAETLAADYRALGSLIVVLVHSEAQVLNAFGQYVDYCHSILRRAESYVDTLPVD